MDKMTEYRSIIKDLLSKYVALVNRHPREGVETLLIADDEQGHYLWMNLGWANGERVKGLTAHVRLKAGKFWIEEDWTEAGIANDLVRAGVPREDIVLAFHEPETRQYTDFAVA
jgi:hypothetical protein